MSDKEIKVVELQTRIGSMCKFDAKELDKIGQVNYLTAVGNPIDQEFVTNGSTSGVVAGSFTRYTSACAHVRIVPTVGRTVSDADGATAATNYIPVVANQMASYIYQLLYNKNMNTAGFSAADILKIILAIDSILAKVSEIKLDLQAGSKAWNKFDFGLPNVLARNYINYQDMILNRALYIDQLDTLIARLKVIEIPLDLRFITWHLSLTNKIYVDDPLHKTSYYRVEYGAYWKYDHNTGVCKLVNVPSSTTITMGADIAALNTMIDELVADEDILNLLANIRLIFGGDAIKVDAFKDDCPEFVYDYMFLSMLKNANFGPSANSMVSNYTLTEVNSGLKTSALQVGLVPAPVGSAGGSFGSGYLGVSFDKWLLSYDANDPKVDELVVISHWVNTFRSRPGDTDSASNEYLWYHGSEVMCSIEINYVLGSAGTLNPQTATYSVDGTDIYSIGSGNNPYIPWQAVLMHNLFNFLPRTYFATIANGTVGPVIGCIWQDTENLFRVTPTYLGGTHEYTLRNQIGNLALETAK